MAPPSNNSPRVTVFIPVYNREDFIGEAIRSILRQSYQDFELLIVDDGSQDRTPDIISGFDDPRIRLERNRYNLGIPATRNRGLELARGEFFALLDSDDIALPERIRLQVEALDQHPELALIGAWSRGMDTNGRVSSKAQRLPVHPDAIRTLLLFDCAVRNRTVMARTEILRHFGYREDFPVFEDYELNTRLAQNHLLANLPRVLVYGRHHGKRATSKNENFEDLRKKIMGNQLEGLGVPLNPETLQNHYTLSRMRPIHYWPDREFLEWTRFWLDDIRNHLPRNTTEPDRILERIWYKACRRGYRRIGTKAWRMFLKTPRSLYAFRKPRKTMTP